MKAAELTFATGTIEEDLVDTSVATTSSMVPIWKHIKKTQLSFEIGIVD
jgi:hypothetical protein